MLQKNKPERADLIEDIIDSFGFSREDIDNDIFENWVRLYDSFGRPLAFSKILSDLSCIKGEIERGYDAGIF